MTDKQSDPDRLGRFHTLGRQGDIVSLVQSHSYAVWPVYRTHAPPFRPRR
jgi:hypothetical protein